MQHFDVIVVGAGHAGCEAAFAAARMGCTSGSARCRRTRSRTCPATRRSAAPQGPSRSRDRCAGRRDGSRHRCDRDPVQAAEPQPRPRGVVAARAGRQAGLRRVGAGARSSGAEHRVDLRKGRPRCSSSTGAIVGLAMEDGERFGCAALVVTTGTFLNGLIHIGPEQRPAGRAGEPPSRELAESLKSLGFEVGPAEDRHAAAARIATASTSSRFARRFSGARRRAAGAVFVS